MGVLLGLAAAVGFGSADFLARYATQRVGSYRTLLFMQPFGLIALTFVVLLAGDLRHTLLHSPWQSWAWTLGVTVLEIGGVLALYRSFETGVLSIVSPIAASFAAVTVALSVLSGETISRERGAGTAFCLAGVMLASYMPAPGSASPHARSAGLLQPGVGWALVAACSLGFTFWLFGFQLTPRMGSVVPVWVVRVVTPCLLVMLAIPLRQSIAIPAGSVWWLIAGVGVLDTAAFLATTVALRHGSTAIVSMLISLFSPITVLLAWIFLREHLRPTQWAGIGIIFVGVLLVST